MKHHHIQSRSIGDSIYTRNHPQGDPFKIRRNLSVQETKLLGLGLGLYWGEGNKKNKYSVRLGNTDPALLEVFVNFLVVIFQINRSDIKYGLQIFTDIDAEEAKDYWKDRLDINDSQFYKITVTISGSIGTYRQKSRYGVLTVYYHNKKLRDILNDMLPT